MHAMWKIILSKQIRSFQLSRIISGGARDLSRNERQDQPSSVRAGQTGLPVLSPESPGRVSSVFSPPARISVCGGDWSICRFGEGGGSVWLTLIFTRVPSTETNLDTINSMTGQNLTKPVHNQKLNLFLKLENPRRRSLDTAWWQPARQKYVFWVRFSLVVVWGLLSSLLLTSLT